MAVNLTGWNDVLMYIIETVLKLIIMVVIPYVFAQIGKNMKGDIEKKYLALFEKFVEDAVTQVQQTYVDNMKAEDLFDKEAQEKAFNMVKDNVLKMMNERMQTIVMSAVGDFDEYIRNLIEAQVYRMKDGVSAESSAA